MFIKLDYFYFSTFDFGPKASEISKYFLTIDRVEPFDF